MPSSPIHRFPLSDSSASNFDCETTITDHYKDEKSLDEIKGQGQELFRRHSQRPFILQTQKSHSRRRYTFSGHADNKILSKKRRRFASVALPTKFLLGGNSRDPLNLGSLQDEEINKQLNAFSPVSSPMPLSHWRSQVQIVIPQNICDPLNLNKGDDIDFSLLSSKRRRRRHRKGRKEDENMEDGTQISPSEEMPPFNESFPQVFLVALDDAFANEDNRLNNEVHEDKIVSPVVSQGSPLKVVKNSLSRSISKDIDSKLCCTDTMTQKSFKFKVDNDVPLKLNAAKFSYGNHARNFDLNDLEESDQRVQFFDNNMFDEKDVLDIGCNTGYFTLYVAKQYKPKKITGLDIDKNLIKLARKKSCSFLSQNISNKEFPQCMAAVYGPLVKVMQTIRTNVEFPDNVAFIEANYVPSSDDFLEVQQPKYDTILCLRVTKWIHLNYGDEGLQRAFKKMYAQLRFGGSLILEPQPWSTYSAHKRRSPATREIYRHLQMKPNCFCQYLMSEVGFTSCHNIGKTYNHKKGYRQDIFLLTKGYPEESAPSVPIHTFHSDLWTENSHHMDVGAKDTVSD